MLLRASRACAAPPVLWSRRNSSVAPEPRARRLAPAPLALKPARDAFFPHNGIVSTPIIARGDLTRRPRNGPLIVEEYDATTVVPPGWAARLDGDQNIVIEMA